MIWRIGKPRVIRLACFARKGCTPAQFALAWVLAQGNDMIPIPGTKRLQYLEDNMGASAVQLTERDLKETDARFREMAVAGERYLPDMMWPCCSNNALRRLCGLGRSLGPTKVDGSPGTAIWLAAPRWTNNPRINLPIREIWGQSVLRYPNGSKNLRGKRFPIGSPLEVSPLTW